MHLQAKYEYTRDDARQRIRIRLRQAPDAADYIAIVDRQIADGTWHFDIVYDVRAQLTGLSSKEDIQTAREYVERQVAALGPRGAVAVVSPHTEIVAAAQIYAYRARGIQVEVFWDMADAERWLDERRSRLADAGGQA